jgi:hypothetical protein
LQHHILCIEIWELNLQARAQRLEIIAPPCNIVPSSADLHVCLNSQPYAKPKFMLPQNRLDNKYPDAMIDDFGSLRNNWEDAIHHLAICSRIRELIKQNSHNRTFISDEQLHTMEL